MPARRPTEWNDPEVAPLREAFPFLETLPRGDLPRLWAALMLLMRDRGLIRAQTSVPAEIAEALVAAYTGGSLAQSSSQKGYDILAGEERIQVKALRYTDPGRNSVGAFPLADKGFDRLIIVCFEYDMTLRNALSIQAADLDDLLTRPAGATRGRLTLTNKVLQDARVRQISSVELLSPGAGARPDVRLDPRVVDFGLMPSEADVRQVEIKNHGGGCARIHVDAETIQLRGWFALVDPPSFPLTLAAGQSQAMTLRALAPDSPGPAEGIIRFVVLPPSRILDLTARAVW
ncbi:MAG: hypothetical protein ACR2LK_09090 [Solirubrobacteraceae bacterium]